MPKAEEEDLVKLRAKRKAITTLLPYAARKDYDGQPEMLDILLHAAGASRPLGFIWYCPSWHVTPLLPKTTPRAIILALLHLP